MFMCHWVDLRMEIDVVICEISPEMQDLRDF